MRVKKKEGGTVREEEVGRPRQRRRRRRRRRQRVVSDEASLSAADADPPREPEARGPRRGALRWSPHFFAFWRSGRGERQREQRRE